MKPEEVLRVVCREMTAYAHGWRLDWSDFDGRILRDQLNDLEAWARRALENEVDQDYLEGSNFLKERGI